MTNKTGTQVPKETPEVMKKELAPDIVQGALEFMSRTQLQGKEVDAYQAIRRALVEYLNA